MVWCGYCIPKVVGALGYLYSSPEFAVFLKEEFDRAMLMDVGVGTVKYMAGGWR